MKYFLENKTLTKDLLIHSYKGLDKEALFSRIHEAILVLGYKKLGTGLENVMYEKGDKTMRILFGAFHKYFKVSMSVSESDTEELLLIIKNASSGFSGGIIGINQVKQEFANLALQLQSV